MGLTTLHQECPFNDNAHKAAAANIIIPAIVLAWYIVEVAVLILYDNHSAPIIRIGSALNSLSGLLAIGAGILLIYTQWPQPLLNAAWLTVLLAQASGLGWIKYLFRTSQKEWGQNDQEANRRTAEERSMERGRNDQEANRPTAEERSMLSRLQELVDVLLEKLPDNGAVGLTVLGLCLAQQDYTLTTTNTFVDKHRPSTYGIVAAVVVGVSSLLGCCAVCMFYPLIVSRSMLTYAYRHNISNVAEVDHRLVAAHQCSLWAGCWHCGDYHLGGLLRPLSDWC